MRLTAAVFAATALAVTSANATSIYTTTGGDLIVNSYNYQVYEDDGVQMTVTAGLYTDGAGVGDAVVTEGQYGARPVVYGGAGTGVSHNENDGEHTVDGLYPEILILSFDTTVKLTSILFNYVNDYGKFDLFIDSDDDGELERVLLDSDLDSGSDHVSLTSLLADHLLVGKLFGIGTSWAEEVCYWRHGRRKCDWKKSEWKLKKVRFEEVPDVPLPAALPLFMAGLAGFGFATRKKKA